MKKNNNIIISILSGMIIGVGGTAYLSCDNKYIGAFLFSTGLITIVLLGMKLYTGLIGYVNKTQLLSIIVILICNLIGAYIMGKTMAYTQSWDITNIVTSKLLQNHYITLIRSIMCGVLMYIAVEGYKRSQNILLLILPVMIFILCGFEHCIANMFYFSYFGLSTNMIPHILISIIGNTLGSILIHNLIKIRY